MLGRAVCAGVVASLLVACTVEREPETIDFENRSAATVWVGYNAFAPEALRVFDDTWVEIGPGERRSLTDGGNCLDKAYVVATAADVASIIDTRPLWEDDEELCPGDAWVWSGVGDHD